MDGPAFFIVQTQDMVSGQAWQDTTIDKFAKYMVVRLW